MRVNKRLKSYLIQLPLVGLLVFAGGLILGYVFISSDAYWSIYYLPFKLAGILVAYLLCTKWSPGGAVNYHILEETKNKDEVKLDKLIAKNNEHLLVTFVTVLFSAIYFYFNIIHYDQSAKFIFSDGIGLTIAMFITILGLSEGAKYMTAWWNIDENGIQNL